MGQHSDHHRHRFDSYRSRGSRRRKRSKGVTGKKKPREVASQERLYHWHNEPDTADVPIDLSYIRDVVEREMARYGTTHLNTFLRERKLITVYHWIIHNQRNASVEVLKRFCKVFGIDPNSLERKGAILNPSFPVNMSSKAFIKVKIHVSNEGRISFGYKSVNVLSYINQDPVLLGYFIDAVKKAGGKIKGKPRLRNALEIKADRVLARALVASGLQFGKKTRTNPSLDNIVEKNRELLKYPIQATLTEEGGCSLMINHSRRARFGLAWGRAIDITDKLIKEQINEIRELTELGKKKISIGNITNLELLRIIGNNPPKLFDREIIVLSATHVGIKWPTGHPEIIHFSKKDRITIFWVILLSRPELIDLIHDEYGMLPGTWKARRFENLYKAYKEFRGRRLTDEEIQEVRKIKEENPPQISVEWISEKVRELFPNIEWGADLDWIRKKLGRKESK